MNGVKRLRQAIMARELGRQIAERQIRTGVLNRFTALWIPETVAIPNT